MQQRHKHGECKTCIRSKGVLDFPVSTSKLVILRTHNGYIALVPHSTWNTTSPPLVENLAVDNNYYN